MWIEERNKIDLSQSMGSEWSSLFLYIFGAKSFLYNKKVFLLIVGSTVCTLICWHKYLVKEEEEEVFRDCCAVDNLPKQVYVFIRRKVKGNNQINCKIDKRSISSERDDGVELET